MPNQKAIEAAKGYIGSLSAARQKAYAGLLKDDEALEELGQSVMLQSDYTRKTQEAAETRKALEKEANDLKERRAALEKWREDANKKFDSTLKEKETLQTRLTEAEARMQTLSAKYQIPEEEIKLQMQATGQDAATAAAKVANQGGKAVQAGQEGADMSQYLSQEMFQQESASLAVANAQVFDLMREHEKLFGESIKAADLIKGALQKGTSLQQYWESEYKVADKRQEVAAQERADWERKIREEERAKIASEYEGQGLNPGTAAPRSGHGSPLLERFNRGDFNPFASEGGEGESAGQRAAHVRDGSPDAIRAAVADFNSRLSASDAA